MGDLGRLLGMASVAHHFSWGMGKYNGYLVMRCNYMVKNPPPGRVSRRFTSSASLSFIAALQRSGSFVTVCWLRPSHIGPPLPDTP